MKKTISLSFLSFLLAFAVTAQQRSCATMQDLEDRMRKDSGLAQRMSDIESFTERKIEELKTSKISGSTIIIPVVVHVLYRTTSENISAAQVQSQIDVLNEDFRRSNSDKSSTWPQAADTQIQFCLAKVDPNGSYTSGITRKYSNKSEWSGNSMKSTSQGGVSPWDTRYYLNIWVVNKIAGGVLGFAQFPGGSRATDGVVIGHQYFGRVGNVKSPYDKGRTGTHEVGHFLNLRHIWGDANCGNDYVSDTPSQQKPNAGCNNTTTCGSRDMNANYMDYTDDACMSLFTLGQKNRMRAVLLSGGPRSSLGTSNKCSTSTSTTTTTSGSKCDGVKEYSSGTSYSVGSKVTSKGTLYQRTSTGWSNLGSCGAVTVNDKCSGVATYSGSKSYATGSKIIYNGSLYQKTSTGWSNLGSCGSGRDNDALGELTTDDLISVYPNPVKGGTLYVNYENKNISFKILNMLGQEVSEGSTIEKGVDVSSLGIGLYLIKFDLGDNKIKTRKFIKK